MTSRRNSLTYVKVFLFPLPTYLETMLFFFFVSEEMRVLTRPSNNLKPIESKTIHHPQLPPPTQRRQNRNPACRGARKHEFRSPRPSHYGYMPNNSRSHCKLPFPPPLIIWHSDSLVYVECALVILVKMEGDERKRLTIKRTMINPTSRS